METDPGHEIYKEALRSFVGHEFHRATFDRGRFRDDHAHCIACWRTITDQEQPAEAVTHEGSVAVHETRYDGLPTLVLYAWLCTGCFDRFSSEFDLKCGSGEIPLISEESQLAFDAAYKAHLVAQKKATGGIASQVDADAGKEG